MKLLFKERIFSWFGSYDIYGEDGETIFTVEGKLDWGHCLHILDSSGTQIGAVRQKVSSLLPRFELYAYGEYLGCIRQESVLFHNRFSFECSDWQVEGDWKSWDYTIVSPSRGPVAAICRVHFQLADTYAVDVPDRDNALCVLMSVLAIDASRA